MTNKQKTDWDFNGDFEDIQLGITKSEDIKNRRFITSWLNRKRLELLTRFDTQKKQLLKTQRQQLISEIKMEMENYFGHILNDGSGKPMNISIEEVGYDIIKILENK